MVNCARHTNTQEVEAGRSGVHDYPCLHNGSEAILKINKTQNNPKSKYLLKLVSTPELPVGPAAVRMPSNRPSLWWYITLSLS